MWWQAQVPLEKTTDMRVRADACLRLEAFCKAKCNETYLRTIGVVCLDGPLIERVMHMALIERAIHVAVFLYGVAVRADVREVVTCPTSSVKFDEQPVHGPQAMGGRRCRVDFLMAQL